MHGILDLLEVDEILPPNAVDHVLVGKFAGYRDWLTLKWAATVSGPRSCPSGQPIPEKNKATF